MEDVQSYKSGFWLKNFDVFSNFLFKKLKKEIYDKVIIVKGKSLND